MTYSDPPSPAKYQCALQLIGPEQAPHFLSLSYFSLAGSQYRSSTVASTKIDAERLFLFSDVRRVSEQGLRKRSYRHRMKKMLRRFSFHMLFLMLSMFCESLSVNTETIRPGSIPNIFYFLFYSPDLVCRWIARFASLQKCPGKFPRKIEV